MNRISNSSLKQRLLRQTNIERGIFASSPFLPDSRLLTPVFRVAQRLEFINFGYVVRREHSLSKECARQIYGDVIRLIIRHGFTDRDVINRAQVAFRE